MPMTTLPKYRILLITSFFAPHIGGSQRYMDELLAHVVQDHPNVQVDILAYNTDNAPEKESYRGMTLYRIPCFQLIRGRFNLPNPFALYRMLQQLKKNNYTHVQTHLRFFDTTWWAWIYAKSIHATSMFTEHVATHPVYQKKIVEWIALLVDKTIGPLSINHYDVLMTTNQKAKEFLSQEIGIKKPIHIVYGGVDTTMFTKANKSKTRSLPHISKTFNESDIIISFAARFIWTKGVTVLYEAIGRVLPTLPPNVYFVIAGDGELKETIHTSIQKDLFEDRVFIPGALSSNEVRDLLSQTDIFVHPSHHNEGFPNAVLEAGAAGCFVIATDIGGTDEILINDSVGTLIQPKDVNALSQAIQTAIQNPQERHKKARAMQDFIRNNLDWKQINSVYYKLL